MMFKNRILANLLVYLVLTSASILEADEKFSVAFINPDTKGNTFWDLVTENMLAAALDLDIEVNVHYANQNRFASLDIAKALIEQGDSPDYFIYMYQAGSSKKILDLAEKHQIKSFTINTRVHPLERHVVATPRQKYKYWIGQMYPDDERAGSDLAAYLIEEIKHRKGELSASIIGLSGTQDSSAALERNKGLLSTVEYKKAKVEQIVFAQWSGDVAVQKLDVLLNRYPEANIIWAASDHMAVASANFLEEQNVRDKYVIGGIDWTQEGLNAVRQGVVDVSVGGHFGEGAWALILLHDFHLGLDFKASGLTRMTQMQVITPKNVEQYLDKVLGYDFQSVDYKAFSRVLNPLLAEYDFSLDALLKAVSHKSKDQ